jgi:hypothetical protein
VTSDALGYSVKEIEKKEKQILHFAYPMASSMEPHYAPSRMRMREGGA